MIFGTHLALDNSDHVLDGGPNPPTEGSLRGVLQNVPRHVSCIIYKTYHVTFRSATSALAELLYTVPYVRHGASVTAKLLSVVFCCFSCLVLLHLQFVFCCYRLRDPSTLLDRSLQYIEVQSSSGRRRTHRRSLPLEPLWGYLFCCLWFERWTTPSLYKQLAKQLSAELCACKHLFYCLCLQAACKLYYRITSQLTS